MIRIVSFLGLGNPTLPLRYHSVWHELDGALAAWPTHIKDVVLVDTARRTGAQVSTLMLLTQGARKTWFSDDRLFAAAFEAVGCPAPPTDILDIPDGGAAGDEWQIFQEMVAALDPAPRAAEHAAPTAIWIDITHGFRALPFLALAAATVVKARTEREGRAPMPPIRVLYAALEAKRVEAGNTIIPFWDLSAFGAMLDWNAALDDLLRHGRAGRLRALIERTHATTPLSPELQAWAEAADTWADALVTMQLPQLLGSASQDFLAAGERARPHLQKVAPPAVEILDSLDARLRSLLAAPDGTISTRGVRAGLEVARLCVDLERYSELAAVLVETSVTAWQLAHQPGLECIEPGAHQDGYRAARARADESVLWSRWATDEAKPFKSALQALKEDRNFVAHAGMRERAQTPTQIKEALEGALKQMSELLPLTEHRQPLAPPCFVNCSNHPSADWTPAQRDAATARVRAEIGEADPARHVEIIDVPFPHVDPAALEDAVAKAADKLYEKLKKHSPTVVHIAGESVTTWHVVRKLLRSGITTVAATTVRDTTVDEPGTKLARFRFERWRSYGA